MSREKMEISDFFERLELIRHELLLNQSAFAAKIKILQSFYSDLKRGKARLSGLLLYGLAEAFPWVNLVWLLTGKGEMFTDRYYGNCVKETRAEYQTSELQNLFRIIEALPARKRSAMEHFIKGQLELLK